MSQLSDRRSGTLPVLALLTKRWDIFVDLLPYAGSGLHIFFLVLSVVFADAYPIFVFSRLHFSIVNAP